jgi:3'(2'), 5'-bisphosphate nucleotidase
MLDRIDIDGLIAIAREAGAEIMRIYDTDFGVENKEDKSPLTEADRRANAVIVERLRAAYPDIPMITEENKEVPYAERKDWDWFWLIDPLDGTKEFIKRNGEFTVNIALVRGGKPVAGVIYVPAKDVTYWAMEGRGAHKVEAGGDARAIRVKDPDPRKLVLIGSRSHPSAEFDAYLNEQQARYEEVDFVAAGSSLKLCLVAEGVADVYPRLGPTMEWDTGAGHAIALEAGASVKVFGQDHDLAYNKENLLNPFFIVERAG